MRLGISRRKNETRFVLAMDNINESAVMQNMFPYIQPAERTGNMSVPASRDNLAKIMRVTESTIDLRMASQAKSLVENLEKQEQEYILARERMENLYDSIILPYQEKEEVPDLPNEMRPKVTPMSHQKVVLKWMYEMLDFRLSHAIFAQQGTGKTYVAVVWAEFLIDNGFISDCLVVSPLFTLWNAWVSDIKKFTSLDEIVIRAVGSNAKKKRRKQLHTEADMYLINHHAAHRNKDLLAEKQFDMIVIDESSCIKNPDSKLIQSMREVAVFSQHKMILNGTPAPNGPLDLWGQWFWLDGGLLFDTSYRAYRTEYMFQVHDHFWKPKSNSDQLIREKMRPFCITFQRADIMDLPERQSILRWVRLRDQQRTFYNDLEHEQFAEHDGRTVSYATLLPKFNKLRQALGGFFFTDEDYRDEETQNEKEVKELANNEKLGCLQELISEILREPDSSIIIWACFRYEIESISRMLSKDRIPHLLAYGGQSTKITMENVNKFVNPQGPRIIVANPKSIGVGTNLQRANFTVYYSLTENLQDYLQSLDRNYRTGQDRKVVVYYLVAKDSYDERLISSLRRKEDFQSYVSTGFHINELRDPDLEESWENLNINAGDA